jgi:thioredoxin 1
MSGTAKIGIVVALVAAVGGVLALKYAYRAPATEPSVARPAGDAGVSGRSPLTPRLVELGGSKCLMCQMMAPVLEELKRDYAGRLRVDVHDVNEDPDLGEMYGVRIIPTQIFYDAAGRELFRHEGFLSKQDILAKWKELGFAFEAPADSP